MYRPLSSIMVATVTRASAILVGNKYYVYCIWPVVMTSLEELLLRAKGLSEGEIASLPASLEGKTGKGSLFISEYPLCKTYKLVARRRHRRTSYRDGDD